MRMSMRIHRYAHVGVCTVHARGKGGERCREDRPEARVQRQVQRDAEDPGAVSAGLPACRAQAAQRDTRQFAAWNGYRWRPASAHLEGT